MGFLDGLTGGGEGVDLTLAVDPLEVLPGGHVVVKYELSGALDDKCTALIIGLEGRGLYTTTETTTDYNGGSTTREVTVYYALHDEPRQHVLEIGPGQSVFTIPAGVPPSSEGSVSWVAYGRVVREWGADEDETVDVVVRLPGENLPTERAPQQGEDGITFEGVPVAVRLGDTVTGHVAATLTEDTRVKDLTVSLVRRVVSMESGINDTSVLPSGPLASFDFSQGAGAVVADLLNVKTVDIGRWRKVASVEVPIDRDFAAGSLERIPFSFKVPANAGPTTAHGRGRVEWGVQVEVDRKGAFKGDLNAEIPLFVY